jgi:hypothetical protein
MIRGKSQAAVQAFREAVKFKYVPPDVHKSPVIEFINSQYIICRRNSWEIWENYSKVALDTGNIRLVSMSFEKLT